MASACALAVVATGGTVRVATAGEVAVVADGQTVSVDARSAKTAQEALTRAGIQIGPHDEVTPRGELHKGQTVTVRRAHPFTLKLDGAVNTEWSVRDTVGDALRDRLGDKLTGAAVDQILTLPLYPDQMTVSVSTVKHATVVVSGKPHPVTSNAETVEGLLKAANVSLGGRDLVLPGPAARVTEGMTVNVSKLGPGQHLVASAIPFTTVRQRTDQLLIGQSRVAAEGTDGVMITLYEDTVQDGKVVDSRMVRRSVAVPAQPRIILVGTREPSSASSGNDGPYSPAGDTVWDRLAACESGNNWHINTGNGYYGGLQFDLSTWRAYGGTGYPHEHSRDEQIAVAERLRAARGFTPWPVCGRRLGLI